MDPSRTVGIVTLVFSIPQGFAASFQIIDRINLKKLKAPMFSSKRTWLLAGLLFLGMASCIGFGSWMLFADPFRPVTIEKIVTVEKTVPCPPAKTGAATSKGANSPANSGSGNNITYGLPPASSQAPKKE
jgi:hypothetical protein